MRVAVFGTKPYDRTFLERANAGFGHRLEFLEPSLNAATAILARGHPGACVFVHDQAPASVMAELAKGGTRLLALRCAGFNNVDLKAARGHGVRVVRVPAYSPHAVAEHAIGLMLSLARKIHRAHLRAREGNFALHGLLGLELHGKTVGVVGTGRIGAVAASILGGFGCRVLAHDPAPRSAGELPVEYVELDRLFREADVVTLHCPLTAATRHLVNARSIALMKPGVMLVNTGRGGLVETRAVIGALKSGVIGALGLDVYEEEEGLFFEDHSDEVIGDDLFARLQTFPNVLITGHQAFFTAEAMEAIARTTLQNIADVEGSGRCANELTAA